MIKGLENEIYGPVLGGTETIFIITAVDLCTHNAQLLVLSTAGEI